MKNIRDITNQRFGKLVAIKFQKREGKYTYWLCRCDCGNESIFRLGNLTSGDNRSCGCLRKELTANKFRTHGLRQIPEYKTWSNIKNRCLNINTPDYEYYGARGITVCKEWIDSFEAFYNDMGPRPSLKHSIDRINNDLGYYKENCRWATKKEQCNNQRSNVKIINTETNEIFNTIVAAAKANNINKKTLWFMLNGKSTNNTKLKILE